MSWSRGYEEYGILWKVWQYHGRGGTIQSRDVVVEGCVRAYIFLRGLHTSRSAVARQYSNYLASLPEEAVWHRDMCWLNTLLLFILIPLGGTSGTLSPYNTRNTLLRLLLASYYFVGAVRVPIISCVPEVLTIACISFFFIDFQLRLQLFSSEISVDLD